MKKAGPAILKMIGGLFHFQKKESKVPSLSVFTHTGLLFFNFYKALFLLTLGCNFSNDFLIFLNSLIIPAPL